MIVPAFNLSTSDSKGMKDKCRQTKDPPDGRVFCGMKIILTAETGLKPASGAVVRERPPPATPEHRRAKA
jgi:hypothetical protein